MRSRDGGRGLPPAAPPAPPLDCRWLRALGLEAPPSGRAAGVWARPSLPAGPAALSGSLGAGTVLTVQLRSQELGEDWGVGGAPPWSPQGRQRGGGAEWAQVLC